MLHDFGWPVALYGKCRVLHVLETRGKERKLKAGKLAIFQQTMEMAVDMWLPYNHYIIRPKVTDRGGICGVSSHAQRKRGGV